MVARSWLGLLVFLWSGLAWAVLPDQTSYDKLRDDILITNQAEFAGQVALNDWVGIAGAYNQVATPTYWVFRRAVREDEIYETTTSDGTTWSWPLYIALTVQQQQAWDRMVGVLGRLNPSLANTRQGMADIWSGSPNLPQRQHLLRVCRREALRIEHLLATGTGSANSPGTMGYEGTLTDRDVAFALGRIPSP